MMSQMLRDVPGEEIASELGNEAITQIDTVQRATYPATINWDIFVEDQLFSRELVKEYTQERLLGLLACNTAMYDDKVEDAIEEDTVITKITELRAKDQLNAERYTMALRARRSVVAFLLEHKDITATVEQTTENNQHSAA